MENGLNYLKDHLREVVEGIVMAGGIRLGAMGIGYQTDKCYTVSSHVEAPDELGSAVISLLERMLIE